MATSDTNVKDIPGIVAVARASFESGATTSVAWRKKQVRNTTCAVFLFSSLSKIRPLTSFSFFFLLYRVRARTWRSDSSGDDHGGGEHGRFYEGAQRRSWRQRLLVRHNNNTLTTRNKSFCFFVGRKRHRLHTAHAFARISHGLNCVGTSRERNRKDFALSGVV